MSKIIIDKEKIEEVLSRGVEEVLVKEKLREKMLSGRQLRIKFGIDPTGSVLHLGHAVPLRKLREFQNLGHQVILLIGDFTARIGDPTGKSVTRKPLGDNDIANNMKTYIEQASLILDIDKTEVRYNTEWLEKMNFAELVSLSSKVTFAQVSQRADFKERIRNEQDLSLQEFLYPVIQGYDSVVLEADVEIGGTDQKFNLLMGRQLQKRYNKPEQDIITCPLLEGLTGGDKMSKSLGNYVAITEKPEEMYGKIMSIPDNLIINYFTLCTFLPIDEINKINLDLENSLVNPRDLKMKLAYEITKIYHNEERANEAQEHFIKTVQKKEIPDEIENFEVQTANWKLVDLLFEVKLVTTKSDGRRMIEQGAVKVDNEVVKDIDTEVVIGNEGVLLQKGKRGFVRIIKK